MISRKTAITAVLIPAIFLGSCGGKSPAEEVLQVSGAKSAVAVMHRVAKKTAQSNRPSGPLGIFTGIYLAQGIFLPVQSAISGLESILNIQEGQTNSTSDENFALLQEVGEVLQVNVIDVLNRSTNRVEALDAYIQSLYNAGILMERKTEELKALHDMQDQKVREERTNVRDIERNLREALNKPDYQAASEYEEQLTKAKVLFAESQSKEEQTEDMIDRFETLISIAAQRLRVVENNREILVAGLRVISMPGIGDLNILEEGREWRKSRGSSLFER